MVNLKILPVYKESEQLLNEFDFIKLHELMDWMSWTWYFPDGVRVPTVDDLKHQAIEMLEDCIRNGIGYSTGGFFVEKVGEVYRLSFEAFEWFFK